MKQWRHLDLRLRGGGADGRKIESLIGRLITEGLQRRDAANTQCRHSGPLLFALPIADVDPNTPAANARWQFALDTDLGQGDKELKVERKPMPRHWDWPLDAPLAIRAPARSFDWHPNDAQALPEKPVSGGLAETIRLVPYGCTKFRISMFPVTSRAWASDTAPGTSN